MAERLTLADHQFIAALTAVVIDPAQQPADRDLAVELIGEVLPEVTRSHPLIAALVEPAEGLIAVAGTSGHGARAAWSGSIWLAGMALRRFHLHRAGCAREERLANEAAA